MGTDTVSGVHPLGIMNVVTLHSIAARPKTWTHQQSLTVSSPERSYASILHKNNSCEGSVAPPTGKSQPVAVFVHIMI